MEQAQITFNFKASEFSGPSNGLKRHPRSLADVPWIINY
jgi:hypothetical protein